MSGATAAVPLEAAIRRLRRWFRERGWRPFPYQEEVWRAVATGANGLLHAPTGTGKTLAVWLGALARAHQRPAARGPRVLWLTPLRALATDTAAALEAPLSELAPWIGERWRVGVRTGDTNAAARRRVREERPEVLVTTPETLSILLSLDTSADLFSGLETVIVDEWHELLGSKRGVQAELALARLRGLAPGLVTWGLSATLGNLDEALAALVGPAAAPAARLVSAHVPRRLEVTTLVPEPMERFPWAGHMGLRLLPQVLERIDAAATTLVFTNTRAQAERWYESIARSRPDWRGRIALHHGSIDRDLRQSAEAGLKAGRLKCVVATSSLDLGVDFGPVEQVMQIGSPKGVGRLLQRAGRSGHAPGATSKLVCVPTHALELIECAAARGAAAEGRAEARVPLDCPLDVLSQHLVTVACGGGFVADDLRAEVRSTRAYAGLDDRSWRWALDFAARGGPALAAYPDYARIVERFGRWYVASPAIARRHRMSIGTIVGDATVEVRWLRGGTLGTVEESFVSRLAEGERFLFAGRPLLLFRFDGRIAWVKRARSAQGLAVPRWNGGRMPFTTLLSARIKEALHGAADASPQRLPPEVVAVLPLLRTQARFSRLPPTDGLLVERFRGRDGEHAFVFPFAGRLVHDGLATLVAWRIARRRSSTLRLAATDWGLQLAGRGPFPDDEAGWRRLLSPGNLLEDLLECLRGTEMARLHFREIARVAGLVSASRRGDRQTQTSAGLIYDVLCEHDADSMLLGQVRREVLERQFEYRRLEETLTAIAVREIAVVATPRLSPLAFPIWAEHIQSRLSTQDWLERIMLMAGELEAAADQAAPGGKR